LGASIGTVPYEEEGETRKKKNHKASERCVSRTTGKDFQRRRGNAYGADNREFPAAQEEKVR